MAETLRLKRFSNVAILKRIETTLLVQFLDPFREFLATRGMTWSDRAEDFDHVALAEILMSPSVDTPDELLDALYFVDNLADGEYYDRILAEANGAGIDLGTKDPSPEDLTLRVWLADPVILERVHAEQYRTRPKTFLSYFSNCTRRPDFASPDNATRAALEADLNDWFQFKKKGRGARVFPFPKEDGLWLLVRHGQRVKREGTVEANGDSGSIFYRPEKFDVLIYYPKTGELAIYADSKGEREIYCKILGKHLFDDESYFCFESPIAKYTLQPLVELGRDALICSDIPGMNQVELYDLEYTRESELRNRRTVGGDDVFTDMEMNGPDLTEQGLHPTKAKFRVTFTGGRERIVGLEPPNTASFDRETDSSTIHDWMTKRGFVPTSKAEVPADARPGAVLEVV